MSHYDQSNRPALLEEGDEVVFQTRDHRVIRYLVAYNCLVNRSGGENAEIFNVLGLDKYAEATAAYGYCSFHGDWPVSHQRDYEALNRLVLRLYEVLAGEASRIIPVINDSRSRLTLSDTVKYTLHRILYDIRAVGRPFCATSFRSLDSYAVEKVLPLLVGMGVLAQDGVNYTGTSFGNELTYLDCKHRGETMAICIPRNERGKARVLKFIMEQPHSVTKSAILERFGWDSWIETFLETLTMDQTLKSWSQGYYVWRVGRENALAIIAAGGLEAPILAPAPSNPE